MERMLEVTARAEEQHFWFLGLRRNARYMLDSTLGGRPVNRIIDCGAGTGRNLDWLQSYAPSVGLELTPRGLEIGRARGRTLVRGTVARLPFASGCAGLVTSFDVLYCLTDTDERDAVREMYRVLEPGGLALINVAALDMLRGSHSTLTHELRRYSRQRLVTLLSDAGFVIRRVSFTNMMTFPVTLAVRWLDRISGRAATASDADMRVPAWPVNVAFDAALRFEWMLLRVANLPIGTSLMCVAEKPATGSRSSPTVSKLEPNTHAHRDAGGRDHRHVRLERTYGPA